MRQKARLIEVVNEFKVDILCPCFPLQGNLFIIWLFTISMASLVGVMVALLVQPLVVLVVDYKVDYYVYYFFLGGGGEWKK